MAHGDAPEGKWRGNRRMEWVASTLHTTSERGVSSITNAYAHTSAASSRVNWLPLRFKWTRPFRRKTKSGFCACAVSFQTNYTHYTVGWVGPRASLNYCEKRNPSSLAGIETSDRTPCSLVSIPTSLYPVHCWTVANRPISVLQNVSVVLPVNTRQIDGTTLEEKTADTCRVYVPNRT
jgi:hypothetical protein